MQHQGYSVRLCTAAEDLRQAYDVRCHIFHHEQGYALEGEVDQYDPIAAHFILTKDDEPQRAIGTLRLIPYPLPTVSEKQETSESFPFGGSQSESDVAAQFLQAAFGTQVPADSSAADPAPTKAETERTPEGVGAKVSRVALLKQARGKGLGHLLLREAERWLVKTLGNRKADQQGANGPPTTEAHDGRKLKSILIKVSSQEYVVRFYTKMDYMTVGGIYQEEGQPHQLVYKEIMLDTLA